MIAQLTGKVAWLAPTNLVLEVGGVGFAIQCTPNTTAGLQIGADATLHTHLGVREDSLTLYGFDSAAERDAFLVVQSVTGIGPKLALAIVSHLSAGQLRQAILTDNLIALSGVPGVGKKMAQRIVLELTDKALALAEDDLATTHTESGWKDQVILGLQGLGYSAKDANLAWDQVAELAAGTSEVSVSTLMKAALRSLARS
ncbi:MAG: Holliday junction branch migration protein RuvA [Propionibacteriaceae bacterium]|jgi:Holliday junction DNA helicase RuvA|nr:Holliday junction branch migration protein RuvA [Propionibacteriaceae bacterium]